MPPKKSAQSASKPRSGKAIPVENPLARIRVGYQAMAKGAKRIADYILEEPARVVKMTVTDLAKETDSSEGAIINFTRGLGLEGFQHLKISLAQDTVKPVQYIHEDLKRDDTIEVATKKIFHSGIQTLQDTLSVLDIKSLTEAVKIMRAAKRIEIYGIGSSAPIAEDAHYRLLRIGLDAKVVTDSHIQAVSASQTNKNVAVLTVTHSGATFETVAATKLAKEAGAKTIIITNYAKSPIHAHADVLLFTMARETLFRTEAMTSRIAQLCVLDTLIAALALADYDRSTAVLKHTFETLSIKRF